jgi:hypothetical protein
MSQPSNVRFEAAEAFARTAGMGAKLPVSVPDQ